MTSSADLLKRLYAAQNSGADFEAIAEEFFDPDVVWHEATQIPGASSHHGREAAIRYMEGLVATVGDFRVEIEAVTEAGGGRWLATFRLVGEGTISGIPFEIWNAHLVTLRDGKVTEVWHFLDPGEAEAAARE